MKGREREYLLDPKINWVPILANSLIPIKNSNYKITLIHEYYTSNVLGKVHPHCTLVTGGYILYM